MATSQLLRGLRRHPVVTTTVGLTTGSLSYAALVEYQANRHQELYLRQEQEGSNDTNVSIPPPPILPRHYNWDDLHNYWSIRPVSALARLGQIASEVTPLLFRYLVDFKFRPQSTDSDALSRQHAKAWREALTRLGPAFVKAGQQLSIRPDLVPPVVLQELQTLCDSVQPVSDEIAMSVLQDELQCPPHEIFDNLRLVASASLGQVYKGTLKRDGQEVAVKVQRPGMTESFSLDLFLLQQWGVFMDAWTSVVTHQTPYHKKFLQNFAKGSYEELDYEQEARNQKHFQNEMKRRSCAVVIPNVYDEYTSRRVLTSQWMDGIRLSDADPDTIRRLIPVGVELFLTQLLDIGAFHADPHPGNLLVTPQGQLCLLDFGLCAEVDPPARTAMTKAIVNLLARDFDSLVHKDAKQLGFLPHDYDTTELEPILTKILTGGLLESGSNIQTRKRKLLEISNELNQVFFQYPFSVPPFFALVTRGLGLLEGIALTGDPEFDIFRASAPYATKRAMQMALARSWTVRRNAASLVATSSAPRR